MQESKKYYVDYVKNFSFDLDSFELISWNDAKQDQTLQFDSNLNDMDLQTRSQCYGKARICAVILLYYKVLQKFGIVGYVREIAAKKLLVWQIWVI